MGAIRASKAEPSCAPYRFDSSPRPPKLAACRSSLCVNAWLRTGRASSSPASHHQRTIPPFGANWIHEIKHDGFRLMARRDPVGIRLITRNGHDWAARYPLVVEAVNRSCLIDGEVVCCDEKGVAAFLLLRHRRNEPQAFLYAFDLLELNGAPSCARLGTAFA
jgi:ATP-dependent DNA ligase